MDKILIWVGAEISNELPTNLPKTDELVRCMIETLCGKSGLQAFNHRIAEYNAFMHQITRSTRNVVYPDILISQFSRIKAVNINTGIASYLQASYNLNHCYLAMLLSIGATIITTNMDLCIEHAYEAFMHGADKMLLTEYENGVAIYSGTNPKSGKVYHIHGTAENTHSLGGSIEIGRNYFSKTFRDNMKDWMLGDFKLYILGYDGRDIYDVVLFLLCLKCHLKNINWVANVVSTKFRKEQPYPIKKIMECFKDSSIIRAQINEFCRDLYAQKSQQSSESVEKEAFGILYNQNFVVVDWRKAVKEALLKAEEYKDIMLLYINQTVGVPVDELDPEIYNRLELMPEPYKNMYTSLMFRYSHDLISVYGYNLSEDKLLGYERPLFGQELLQLCKYGYNIVNHQIVKITEIVDKMQEDYLSALRRKTLTVRWENEAEELLEDIEDMLPSKINGRILEVPKNNYHEFAALYRLRAAVCAINHKEEEDIEAVKLDLRISFINCSQAANWHGVLKTLSYGSFCYLCFYYKYGKKSYYDKAQQYKSLRKKEKAKGR